MHFNQAKQGFTLIELLVVVLIIGILAAVAIPQYQKAVLKSRLVQMVVWMDSLKKGAELYYLANNAYPTDLRDMDVDLNAKEYKNSINISPGNPAAFFDDTTECMVHQNAAACISKDFYLLRHHNHTSSEPKGIMCLGWNPMAEAVWKSSSDGAAAMEDSNGRYYIIGN